MIFRIALSIGLLLPALLGGRVDEEPEANRYPEAYLIIREGEAVALRVPARSDSRPGHLASRLNLILHAASLYARGGYEDDAARLLGKTDSTSPVLWRSRLVYGDQPGAEQIIKSIPDPQVKSAAEAQEADLLWRMGKPEEARLHFEVARTLASQIENPKQRETALRIIAQGLSFVADPPPKVLSAIPQPVKHPPVVTAARMFPITTVGFRVRDPSTLATESKADEEFLTRLYGFMAAGDFTGLRCITNGADTPFRKALGLASIEHIAIQKGQPEFAEAYAKAVPEDDSDCRLAKAEALTAVARAWLRADRTERAQVDFESALRLVSSALDLPFGAVTVTLSIAAAQSLGGLVQGSAQSFARARELAQQFPLPPPPVISPLRRTVSHPAPGRYRTSVFKMILLSAIDAHDLGAARETAAAWDRAYAGESTAITLTWLDARRTDDALVFARQISDPQARAEALFLIARYLLDQAGAPNI